MSIPFGARLSRVNWKVNILNMHGCVVDQKLSLLHMCSNACMLAAKAFMHVAHVFQELQI